ncbi:MAG: hypothetical protein R2787_04565 [Saprospiraceae bacterium]
MPAPDATMIEPGVWTFSNVGTFIPSVNAIDRLGVDATLDSNFTLPFASGLTTV